MRKTNFMPVLMGLGNILSEYFFGQQTHVYMDDQLRCEKEIWTSWTCHYREQDHSNANISKSRDYCAAETASVNELNVWNSLWI
jgi:hypothetical protein